jgi:hypothetical protein
LRDLQYPVPIGVQEVCAKIKGVFEIKEIEEFVVLPHFDPTWILVEKPR